MSSRSYGYLYEQLGGAPSAADIARAIRADIKQATGEGLLPAGWTYSVRSRLFAGGCAVDVTVKGCADAWQECDGTVPGTRRATPSGGWTAQACGNPWCAGRADPRYAHAAETHFVLTEDAMAARITLQRIHDAYNHDGSDVTTDYFDVRYYGGITFER
jgi:hypothetical protein